MPKKQTKKSSVGPETKICCSRCGKLMTFVSDTIRYVALSACVVREVYVRCSPCSVLSYIPTAINYPYTIVSATSTGDTDE